MRMMKKVMTGMSLAAAALAIAGGVNAADADAASATFNSNQTMTVNGTTQVMVSFDAIKVKNNVATWNAKAKWDVYDGSSATVDLSTVKFTKDVYVTVKDVTNAAPVAYKLTAALNNHKIKGKYSVDGTTLKGGIEFTDTDKSTITVAEKKDDSSKIQYRTATGDWTKYTKAVDLLMYAKQGATLYFRYAPTSDITMSSTKNGDEDGTFKISEQTDGNFASAEVKVKITKEGAAPSATVDYDNATFKVKAGTEVRNLVLNGSSYQYSTAIESATEVSKDDVENGAFVTPKDLVIPVTRTNDGIFEVRTAAKSAKTSKIASKIAVYAYKAVTALNKNDVKANLTIESVEKSGKFNVTVKSDSDEWADKTIVIYGEDPDALFKAEGKKAKVLATIKGKNVKGYKAAGATIKNVVAGTTLYVATASDKATATFRSPAVAWETIGTTAPAPSDTPEE